MIEAHHVQLREGRQRTQNQRMTKQLIVDSPFLDPFVVAEKEGY